MVTSFVSLGSNCTPKLMLEALGILQPTLPFDWLLIPSEEALVKLLDRDPIWRHALGNMHKLGRIHSLGSDDPGLSLTPDVSEAFNVLRERCNQGEISRSEFRSALQATTKENYAVRFQYNGLTSFHDFRLYGHWEDAPERYERRFARLDELLVRPDSELIFIRYKRSVHPPDKTLVDWVSNLGRPCKLITMRPSEKTRWIMESHNMITYEGPFEHSPRDRWILEEAFRRIGIGLPVTSTPPLAKSQL
jgi:hypothetical protein